MTKKIASVLLLALLGMTQIHALDVVRLGDGRVLRGYIVSRVQGESITIEFKDGSRVTYPESLVRNITHEEDLDRSQAAQANVESRGLRILADVGVNKAFSDSRGTWHYTASATAGYQLNRMLFVGGGVEAALLTHSRKSHFVKKRDDRNVFQLPVYAAARLDNRSRRNSPFGEVRLGGNFVGENTGLYVKAALGCRVSRFSLSVNYTMQGSPYYPFYVFSQRRDNISSVGLRLGYEF